MTNRILWTIAPLILSTGCVSKKKYLALESSYADALANNDQLQRETESLEAQLLALESRDPVTATYYRDLLESLKPMMESGDILVHLTDDRMTISFRDQIHFDLADDTLDPRYQRVARELAMHIQDVPSMTFQIEGHTDKVAVTDNAEWDSNWELGAERAITVLQTLVDNGVPEDRLSVASYGDTQPIYNMPGPSEANRRVVISMQPDMAQVDGAHEFATVASEQNALVADGSMQRLRRAPSRDTEIAVTQTDEIRPSSPQMHHDFTIPVVNGDVLRVWTTPGRLNFKYAEAEMNIAVADQAEIRGELDRLQREVDDIDAFAEVRGDEIDDEIRRLLIEAIDADTTVWVNGVAIPGNEVDDEIGLYWEEVFDAPDYMTLTEEEIEDDIERFNEEVNEELRERSN